MSEVYKSAAEWEADEREEKIVAYEDGGSSAIIVDKPGSIVDLYSDNHKYLKSPEEGSRIFIAGHTEEGERAKLVIDGNHVVVFGVDPRGKQFAQVSNTSEQDYKDLSEPLVIGQEGGDAFNGLIIDSVGAEYKAFGGRAEGDPKGQNPFAVADRLVERAKSVAARR